MKTKRELAKKVIYAVPVVITALTLLAFSLPVKAANMDDGIESAAKNSYVFKTYLKDDDIKVQSSDGVVTLTGSVSEDAHKSLAGETVANLPEVKSIDNQLEVKGGQAAEMSDAWILTKVKTTLLFHRSVSGIKTEVDVKDGIVTLRGEAGNQAQKELATEYAKDIDGVKDVRNEMAVAKSANEPRTMGDKIDDASITALVKMTLLYHRSTSALKTSVTTRNGVVTLSGKASNAAEKDLAAKLTSDVNGVTSVENLMTIE